MDKRDILVWLNSITGLAGVRTDAILSYFESPADIVSADEDQLARVKGIGSTLARNIKTSDPQEFLSREYEAASKRNIRIITIDDPEYPVSLASFMILPTCCT